MQRRRISERKGKISVRLESLEPRTLLSGKASQITIQEIPSSTTAGQYELLITGTKKNDSIVISDNGTGTSGNMYVSTGSGIDYTSQHAISMVGVATGGGTDNVTYELDGNLLSTQPEVILAASGGSSEIGETIHGGGNLHFTANIVGRIGVGANLTVGAFADPKAPTTVSINDSGEVDGTLEGGVVPAKGIFSEKSGNVRLQPQCDEHDRSPWRAFRGRLRRNEDELPERELFRHESRRPQRRRIRLRGQGQHHVRPGDDRDLHRDRGGRQRRRRRGLREEGSGPIHDRARSRLHQYDGHPGGHHHPIEEECRPADRERPERDRGQRHDHHIVKRSVASRSRSSACLSSVNRLPTIRYIASSGRPAFVAVGLARPCTLLGVGRNPTFNRAPECRPRRGAMGSGRHARTWPATLHASGGEARRPR